MREEIIKHRAYVKHSFIWGFVTIVLAFSVGTYGFYTWQVVNPDNNVTKVKLEGK